MMQKSQNWIPGSIYHFYYNIDLGIDFFPHIIGACKQMALSPIVITIDEMSNFSSMGCSHNWEYN